MLNGLAEKYDLRVKKIDISSSDSLYALYRFDIPVFQFRDSTTLHSRIKKKETRSKRGIARCRGGLQTASA